MPTIIAIIPAYNEAVTVGDIVRRTRSVLRDSRLVSAKARAVAGLQTPDSRLDHEVIVIDDGSTDQTALEAAVAGATVVRHAENRGVGTAFRTGIRSALERDVDFVVHLDADGQFQPEDIPQLLAPLADGRADIATATRFKDRKLTPAMPPLKRWGNDMVTRMVNLATGGRYTDVSCGFRALTREAALRLTLFGRFTYTQEMFLDAAQKHLTIVEVPLRVYPRAVGESRVYASAFNYALRSAAILFRSFRDSSPLRVFGSAAVAVGGLGVAAGLFVFVHWLQTGQTFPYRSLVILSAVLILLGAFFATIALLADMLKRQRQVLDEILYLERRRTYGNKRESGKERELEGIFSATAADTRV